MANYALVIGINGYASPEWRLNGAVTDALDFARWATATGGVPPDDAHLRLLLSPSASDPTPMLPAGVTSYADATSVGIRRAMRDLRLVLPNEGGERLYFYYAGHGASLPQWKDEPILIPADFSDPELDANLPLGFSEILPVLAGLPFREQIFFIDACRDFALDGFERAVGSAVRLRPEHRGPRQYVLYSVAPGQRAAETGQGLWTSTLLEGLEGQRYQPLTRGRGPEGRPRYEVRLDRLAEWVRNRVAHRIRQKFLGEAARFVQTPEYDKDRKGGNPLLVSFTPDTVPRAHIDVLVEPDFAHPTCKLQVMQYVDARGEEIEVQAKGPPIDLVNRFQLRPSDYSFRAQADFYKLQSKVWTVDDDPVVELTLEEDRAVASPPPPALAGMAPPEGTLSVFSDDPLVRIDLLDAQRRAIREGITPSQPELLPPGIYRVRLRLPGADPIDQTVEVRPGLTTEVQLNLPDPKLGHLQVQVLQTLQIIPPGAGGNVDYLLPAERLGPVAGTSLASLLAFAAYAVNQPDRGDFFKLRAFGITPFAPTPTIRCGLLMLVGAAAKQEEDLTKFLTGSRIVVRQPDGTVVDRGAFEILSGMPAAGQRQFALAEPGSLHAELRLPGFARTRYALATLPGRLTVFIVVVEKDGAVEVQQYLLAVPGLVQHEPGWVAEWLWDRPTNLRRIELAQRFYAAGDVEAGLASADLEVLLWGKWLDPLLGCIAGYALARAGRAPEFAGVPPPTGMADILDHLDDPDDPVAIAARASRPGPSALRNMVAFFPGLPDVHILAALCESNPDRREKHFIRALRYGVPIFAEGTRALAAWFQSRPSPTPAPSDIAAAGTASPVSRLAVLPPELREPMTSLLSGTPWTAWVAAQPVLLVRAGQFEEPPPSWSRALEERRSAIEATLRSVGRIRVKEGDSSSWVGTGFVVAPNLVMTADCVVTPFLQNPRPSRRRVGGLDEGHNDNRLRPGVRLYIDFHEEFAQAEVPTEFEITDDLVLRFPPLAPGIALLRGVAPLSRDGSLSLPPPLTLGRGAPQDGTFEGRLVYAVGYSAHDSSSDPTVMNAVLGGVFGPKRLQPGELLEVLPDAHAFRHDCFTTPGTAGAPVIDLASGLVIGLHHSGRGFYKEAIALWKLANRFGLYFFERVLGMHWRLW